MNENTISEIVRMWRGGSSKRGIARRLGISRHQVDRVIAAHVIGRREGTAPCGLPRPKGKRSSCLDVYESSLRRLLERYPDITAVRAHEELQKLGFPGSYETVKRRVHELRPAKKPEIVQRFETGPGVQAQMDYATYKIDFTREGLRRVHLFGYALGYSRRQFLEFVELQDFITTIREHRHAFEYFDGCAATCLYDNFKVVVSRYDGDEPVYNTRFLAFATHYGFRPRACRPYRPRTKGKIERQFHYVEKNLLNGRTFHSLEHLNQVTRWWLQNVADVRIHRETKQTPLERYEQERAHLIPLPEHPYDTAEVVYRCVNGEGMIVYCQNRYSVPWRYIGLMVPVRITEDEVVIYGPEIEEIARHPLLSREVAGRTSQCKEHLPGDDGEKKLETLKQRYDELGDVAGRFFEGLIRHRRYGKDEAWKILGLLETYRRRDLVAAIERAVRYGAYSRPAIERILAVTATAKPPLSKLAEQENRQLKSLLGDQSVPPRSGKEYGELFRNQPSETCDDKATNGDPSPEEHESPDRPANDPPESP